MKDEFRTAGWWRDETILDDLRRSAASHPGKPALVCYRDGVAETVTYSELAHRVGRLAAGLVRLGVRRGDVVTLQLPNSWQLVASILACARAGAVAGPVVPIMRRREVEFMTRLTAGPPGSTASVSCATSVDRGEAAQAMTSATSATAAMTKLHSSGRNQGEPPPSRPGSGGGRPKAAATVAAGTSSSRVQLTSAPLASRDSQARAPS